MGTDRGGAVIIFTLGQKLVSRRPLESESKRFGF